jgi:hypothetical protein
VFSTVLLLRLLPAALAVAALVSGGVAFLLRRRGPWTPREQKVSTAALILAVSIPLVSLATTIAWLVRAFGTVAHVNAADKATILANGISEAINSFAYGLVLTIPASLVGILTIVAAGNRRRQSAPPRVSRAP